MPTFKRLKTFKRGKKPDKLPKSFMSLRQINRLLKIMVYVVSFSAQAFQLWRILPKDSADTRIKNLPTF